MGIRSYRITRDYGFAPNPFHGYCTLATCMPQVRGHAKIGDLIVGCGSARNRLSGHVIYIMRVTGTCSFQEYWDDARFLGKRPNFDSSISRAYGDSIYHQETTGVWIQERSHHSLKCGSENMKNLRRDTGVDRVLWSDDFVYFGHIAPPIPDHLRNFGGDDLCPRNKGQRARYSPEFVAAVEAWFQSIPDRGYLARPGKWQQASVRKLHERQRLLS